MYSGVKKTIFLLLGWNCLLLGLIGIILPLLPTTPFVLLAAYFFSKSSTKLHAWLLRQKKLGPLIYDWEKYGVIPLRAKILATVMMTALFSYSLLTVKVALFIKGIIASIGIGVLVFIWSRPDEKKRNEIELRAHNSVKL